MNTVADYTNRINARARNRRGSGFRRFLRALLLGGGLLAWQPLAAEPYQAPAWLPGGHLQTLYPLLITPPWVEYRRERWELDDGDFLDADWIDSVDRAAPLLVLFHGLEGDSRGRYALNLMAAAQSRGWRAVVVHFRGGSGEPNRLPRAYHAGDAAEIELIVARIQRIYPDAPMHLVGVSLGGSAMLNWLGLQADQAKNRVRSAVAVSAPIDLVATGNALDSGINRLIYASHFLRTLKTKALAKLDRFPALFDAEAVRSATTLREFDTLVTAPLHGYRDADDYWMRASSKNVLRHIAVPTLLLNARNDPFLPAEYLPTPDQVGAAVTLEFPEQGGHVGFVTAPFPGRVDWLPRRIFEFFAAADAPTPRAPSLN